MKQQNKTKHLSTFEFVSLMAIMISFVALSIDAMLPALPVIATDLKLSNPNDSQMVISFIFIGLGIGQFIYGPLSDAIGRKPPIYGAIGIFIIGSVLSYYSKSFEMMLFGRLLQGLGGAGPRIVTMALIRDRFEGEKMAKIMSLIMSVFILIPAIAPALGLAIMSFFDWRAIFASFFLMASVAIIWFWKRQDETLSISDRRSLSLSASWNATLETLRTGKTLNYILASGLIFGAFVGYLTSIQQIFQDIFGITDRFPIYFALLSLSIGLATYTNSRLVLRWGMLRLTKLALYSSTVVSSLYLLMVYALDLGNLVTFMTFLMINFFCMGILFGNFTSLAMKPLGHIAGVASAVIGALQTLISIPLGSYIGQSYQGTILPVVIGFSVLGTFSIIVISDRIRFSKKV